MSDRSDEEFFEVVGPEPKCPRCGGWTDMQGSECEQCCDEQEHEHRMREADENYHRETGYWPGQRP